jgi:CRISPR-associated protein Cas5d
MANRQNSRHEAIKFDAIRRNEVASKIPLRNMKSAMNGGNIDLHQYAAQDRQQRAAMILRDVEYILEAHFEMTDKAGPTDNEGKHSTFSVDAPEMGNVICNHILAAESSPHTSNCLKMIFLTHHSSAKWIWAWMLWDIDFRDNMSPIFYRPRLINGIIDNVQGGRRLS